MRSYRKLIAATAMVAAATLGLAACGDSGGGDETSQASGAKTLKLWHYEGETSAMAIAWNKAIEIFKTEHPGVTVNFEQKQFEQIQKNVGMIMNSSEGLDMLERN